ncbi:tripartite tricarboxylate transporter TctB family protein [Alteribacter natronophilus]|uniref:tripartite tricarboxylate transporter TctB family protein n=1 Tax=Alteribacter natronophilus TaxID=2583810 RepID=UPI00110F38C4|nr:tripartite tricarboxylate transporter TctB family protein [Alteribacter natronophilus]TMW72844.1 tripartite tricarboxylate transporter TctB family protein [Alteribacter natronophilus]
MKYNIMIALGTVAFAVFFLVITFGIQGRPDNQVIGPTFWPMTILVLMALLGILLFIQTIRENKRTEHLERKDEDVVDEILEETADQSNKKNFWLLVAGLVFYIFTLNIVGFVVATAFIICYAAWLLGMEKIRFLILMPIASSLVLVFIFQSTLNVPLPRGVGIFREISMFFS